MSRFVAGCITAAVVVLAAGSLSAADKPPGSAAGPELPAAVRKTLAAEAAGIALDSIAQEGSGGTAVYTAYVPLDGLHYSLRVRADGTLVEKILDLGEKVSEVEIPLAEVPAAVKKTLEQAAGKGTITSVLKLTSDGQVMYGAGLTIRDNPYWATVAADGTLWEKRLDLPTAEEEIELAECPAPVRETLAEEAAGQKIDTVNRATEGGKVVYGVTVGIGERVYDISVDEGGKLLEKKLEIEPERSLIGWAECPAAVQKTLRTETGQAEIDAVTRDRTEGKSVYGAGAMIGGQPYAFKVGEDGRLLSKVLISAENE